MRTRRSLFWEQDRGLTVLLVFLVVIILCSGMLARMGAPGRTILTLLVTLTLGSGVVAISSRRWAGLTAGAVALAAIAAEWINFATPSPAAEATAALSVFVTIVLLASVVFHQVFRDGRITVHRVIGSGAAYLLIGIAWGELYDALDTLVPGALASSAGTALARADFMYYSIVTLTTLGYGDITPLHPLARSLAMLEALTGQLFPVILIARLVSLELMTHDSPGPPSRGIIGPNNSNEG